MDKPSSSNVDKGNTTLEPTKKPTKEQHPLRYLSDAEILGLYTPMFKQMLGEPNPHVTLARGGKNAEGQDTLVFAFWNDEYDHDNNPDDPCGTLSVGLLNDGEKSDGMVKINIEVGQDEESQKFAKDIVRSIIQ